MTFLTRQEIFDIVAKHLLQQNERAMIDGICVYRTTSGLKCAIGALIPDNVYSVDMEENILGALLMKFPDILRQCNIIDTQDMRMFLQKLQSIHDDIPPREWADELDLFAHIFNLSTKNAIPN